MECSMNKVLIALIFTILFFNLYASEKLIKVRLRVPAPNYSIQIDKVYVLKQEVWIIAKVSEHSTEGTLGVLATVEDTVKLNLPDLPMKTFIIGKDWNWKNNENYTFLENYKPIQKGLSKGKIVYQSKNKKK